MVQLMGRPLARKADEEGAVVVLVAAMTVLLFGIAALVVDLGQARVVRTEAQAASDASALAAANRLYLAGVPTADVAGAISEAKLYAQKNYGITDADWARCTDEGALTFPAPGTECISFDRATKPSAVRVVAPIRAVKLLFAGAFGAGDLPISAMAQASLRINTSTDCGLCILGSGLTHDVRNGEVAIAGGDVFVNGNIKVQPNGFVSTSGSISVEGSAEPDDGFSPKPLEGQPAIEDPLGGLPLPPDITTLNARTDPCADGPGIYGGRDFAEGATDPPCTLSPGLYVVTGRWKFTGGASLDASSGVTLYFTCGTTTAPTPCAAPGQAGGSLEGAGNGSMQVAAPTSGPTAGLAIVYDRLNTSPLLLAGNGGSMYVGTIYARMATLTYAGNGGTVANRSLIVVRSLVLSGANTRLESSYDLDVNVYVPPDGLHLSR